VVFLFHPTELVKEKPSNHISRRSESFLGHLFSDVIRRRLKLKNLGSKAVNLFESILKKSRMENFEFISCKNFRKKYF